MSSQPDARDSASEALGRLARRVSGFSILLSVAVDRLRIPGHSAARSKCRWVW